MQRNVLKLAIAILTALAAMMICAPALSASDMDAQGNKSEAMQRLAKMSAALQLTPAQKEKVRPIVMNEAPKMKALKSDASLGPLQKAMKMRQIADDTDAKLKPILTPQQYQTWQQMRAQERQQMMQKMENH